MCFVQIKPKGSYLKSQKENQKFIQQVRNILTSWYIYSDAYTNPNHRTSKIIKSVKKLWPYVYIYIYNGDRSTYTQGNGMTVIDERALQFTSGRPESNDVSKTDINCSISLFTYQHAVSTSYIQSNNINFWSNVNYEGGALLAGFGKRNWRRKKNGGALTRFWLSICVERGILLYM